MFLRYFKGGTTDLTHRLVFTGRHEIKPQSVVMSIKWNNFFAVSLLIDLVMSPAAISTEPGG